MFSFNWPIDSIESKCLDLKWHDTQLTLTILDKHGNFITSKYHFSLYYSRLGYIAFTFFLLIDLFLQNTLRKHLTTLDALSAFRFTPINIILNLIFKTAFTYLKEEKFKKVYYKKLLFSCFSYQSYISIWLKNMNT